MQINSKVSYDKEIGKRKIEGGVRVSRKESQTAIVWPANPQIAGPEMPKEEADVSVHMKEIEKRGAIYWDSAARRNEIEGPINGYIYVAGKKIVEYKCKVEHVIKRRRLLKMPDERRYVPTFREQCLTGHFPDGKKHDPSSTWIKISEIKPLEEPLKLKELRKLDGEPVSRVQGGFVYIQDPL